MSYIISLFFSASKNTMTWVVFCLFLPLIAWGQREIKPCQQMPAFVRTLGFDPEWTALSTSEKNKMGLALVVYQKQENATKPLPNGPRQTVYQDPAWKEAGYLASITTDFNGNIYTVPAPRITLQFNPMEKRNTLYRIEGSTGRMSAFYRFPANPDNGLRNPFGLLGLHYDCSSDQLVVSDLSGSGRQQEKGKIYLLNVKDKKIVDVYPQVDALGLYVAYDENEKKRIYFGSSRSSKVFSMLYAKNGKWDRQSLRLEVNLNGLGPNGDDKAKKIRMNDGELIVSGIAFEYNLQAASEKPETHYHFRWNPNKKSWQLIDWQ